MMQKERQPLYLQVQEHFKKLIGSGALTIDEKIPSEKELMVDFNVSRITIANALTQLAKEGWIYRIPGRGSFVSKDMPFVPEVPPSPSENLPVVTEQIREKREIVQRERPVGKRMIGFIIPSLDDYFALRLIEGMNKIMKHSDYYLAVILTNHSKEFEKEAIVQLLQKDVAGLIIFPIDAETYNEEILSLKMSHFPFVLIDRYLPGVETHFVCSDSRLGAQLAVSHLWELGHRNIAICSDSPLPTVTVEERIAGYVEALKQRGAMIDPALILTELVIDYDQKDDAHALARCLKNGQATAYITLNAKLALYISGFARSMKLHVPGQLSILSFDDPSSEVDSQEWYTHIAQSEEEIGSRAASILTDLLDRPSDEEGYHKIVLEPKLVVGQSTGPVFQYVKG
ncbi:GntR family transcriptional regulator [Paenibacillus lignilyticus]|nr:GntR family transcriptional regulator [Paenibacillus lignilyticus]